MRIHKGELDLFYEPLKFQYSDGGREWAGFGPPKRDCVARAIAIVSDLPYIDVWKALTKVDARGTADKGIFTERAPFKNYAESLGLVYTEVKGLKISDLKAINHKIIIRISRHVIAICSDTMFDTYPPRQGARIKGYYSYKHDNIQL